MKHGGPGFFARSHRTYKLAKEVERAIAWGETFLYAASLSCSHVAERGCMSFGSNYKGMAIEIYAVDK